MTVYSAALTMVAHRDEAGQSEFYTNEGSQQLLYPKIFFHYSVNRNG
ncbi:MAG: hypothetical protein M3305_16625 [Actinomycetota bacterium]|nr:hypothetical protein [Actinomycetota bacterium]